MCLCARQYSDAVSTGGKEMGQSLEMESFLNAVPVTAYFLSLIFALIGANTLEGEKVTLLSGSQLHATTQRWNLQ